MIAMGAKKKDVTWNEKITIRTDSEVKGALSMLKGRLGGSRRVTFQGRKLTEEAIFGAITLWANAQDVHVLEAMLAPFVARLEELAGTADEGGAHKKTPGLPEGEVEGITTTTINRKRKPGPGRLSSLGIEPEGGGQAV